MNALITDKLSDQATAIVTLNKVRDDLARAVELADKAMDWLRIEIVRIRPLGLLTADEMGSAIGHDRNYIDSTWSGFGETVPNKQTRVKLGPEDYPIPEAYEKARAAAVAQLTKASQQQKLTAAAVLTSRAERDRVVAMVYASKILGPSAIASHVDVDRNHVGRIARRRGVKPVHRATSRNQYSSGEPTGPYSDNLS